MKSVHSLTIIALATMAYWLAPALATAADKPNILVIWGDDIGTWNISHNNRGMMGYKTPNIDRLAKEGVAFTDYYGQQSCTAGRAAFIGGKVKLLVNGKLAGEGETEKAMFRHGVEPFEIGRDSISSVNSKYADKGAFPYGGAIESVTFELTK